MKLSENFTYDEFIRSSTAARLGINNSMKTHEIIRAQKLCMKILQPLRGMACEPVHISSGFRCPELNKAVYGSKTSQHMKAEAADIHINSLTVQQICKLIIDMDLPYHQSIHEPILGRFLKIRRSIGDKVSPCIDCARGTRAPTPIHDCTSWKRWENDL